jgi:hypothetical protein
MAFERFMRTMSTRFDYIVGAIEEKTMEGRKTTFAQAQHSKEIWVCKVEKQYYKGKRDQSRREQR